MKFWSTNENYVYEERLGHLVVLDKPAAAQERLALRDVERFRRERSDKVANKRKADK